MYSYGQFIRDTLVFLVFINKPNLAKMDVTFLSFNLKN